MAFVANFADVLDRRFKKIWDERFAQFEAEEHVLVAKIREIRARKAKSRKTASK